MRKLDKGSALLITLMVMVVLSLTGISFIFLADTENAISNNYYKAMSALMAGQTGVYLVNSWFNSPSRTADLVPAVADLQFNTRADALDGNGNPSTWKSSGAVMGITPFDKPYIGKVNSSAVVHQFYGTEAAPDVQIRIDNTKGQAYLHRLNGVLFGATYAAATSTVPENGGVQISEINLYSAPCAPVPDTPTDATNTPYGICTALIIAQNVNVAGQVVSTRRIRGIITDINYAVSGDAFDVDGSTGANGAVQYHWGNIKTQGDLTGNNSQHLESGGPFTVGPEGIVKYCATLMGTYDHETTTVSMPAVMVGKRLTDPWLLMRSIGDLDYKQGGTVVDCGGPPPTITFPQPANPTRIIPADMTNAGGGNPSNLTCDLQYDPSIPAVVPKSYWTCKQCGYPAAPECPLSVCNPVAPGTYDDADDNYYNLWGCDPSVAFATAFRGYTYWKRVVVSASQQGGGTSNSQVHYLVPGGAAEVNGLCSPGYYGPPGSSTNCKDFADWTAGKVGLWFFDTTDGKIPKKNGSNITGNIAAHGGGWTSEGLIYLCANKFTNTGNAKANFKVCYPGEPLWENLDPAFASLVNGSYDDYVEIGGTKVFVDRYLNLAYPDAVTGGQPNGGFAVSDTYADQGMSLSWDKYGPENVVEGVFHGIFYMASGLGSGVEAFRAAGGHNYYGSLMIWNGDAGCNGTIDVWYDAKLRDGIMSVGLPNSYIEQILTDM